MTVDSITEAETGTYECVVDTAAGAISAVSEAGLPDSFFSNQKS
jgi:hypothetical protein